MPRYSNDGWANLLAAVDYKNAEPEREANQQIRMMQLQALKDANRKRTELETYRAGLDAPITPETTQIVPDTVASAQTDPNALYQEQPTKEVTVPATYLNEIQKLEKMERYMAMQGNYQEAKQLNEYIKQTKEMGQHNPIVWQAWEASGGNVEITKKILMAHGATQEQVDDIDFSMAGMGALGSKRAGMYMTREGKTIHNKPKEATPKAPKQVIVNDEIKYIDDNNEFVEGLGGPRYKPSSGDSGKEAKRDAREAKKEQLKIYDDAIKDYDHNIQFAKGQLRNAQIYDSQNPGEHKYEDMVNAINENQKQRDITASRRRDYLSGKKSTQPEQETAKKKVGTKNGVPVYELPDGNWQVGD